MKKTTILIAGILLLSIMILIITRNQPETMEDYSTDMEETDSETILLQIFDKNVNNEEFDDDVAKKIMEKTGVEIQIIDATDDSEEKIKTMLRDNNYPDIVLLEQGELVNQYIESGALIPLDELVGEYGPNIQEMYGDILNKSRYNDGKLYWFANWYGKDTDASAGVLMRKDILENLVGKERANSNKPFTLSEYTEILRAFKRQYPKLNGYDSIALELDQDSEIYKYALGGMFGLKSYGIDEKENLHILVNTEEYRDALLYLNQLYLEGLLDKEWIINKTSRWKEKLSDGYVFSTWGSYWDTDEINHFLSYTYGEDCRFYCYKVMADNLTAEETTYNARNSLGWDAIGITDHCKNPEAAIRLLDYLASEEGQYLLLWGLEGRGWTMEDGKHVPMESFLSEWEQIPSNTEQRTGVRRWTWMIKNGKGSDGTPYDLTNKYATTDVAKFANNNFLESDFWDISEFTGIEPSVTSSLGFQWQIIQDIYEQYFPKVICAASEKYAGVYYEKMIDDMKLAGLEECEQYITEQYKERQAQLYK